MDLPHCDELFLKFFDPWYDDDDRARRGFPATRPDMLSYEGLKGRTVFEMRRLNEEGLRDVSDRINRMFAAARNDWSFLLPDKEETLIGWLAAIDADYDRERIRKTIDHSNPNEYANDYVVTCCELGTVIGRLLEQTLPRLEWHFGWPYWESALFDSETGTVVPVFHWAVKKMSEYGVDDGLVDKVEACAGILAGDQDE